MGHNWVGVLGAILAGSARGLFLWEHNRLGVLCAILAGLL